MISLRTTTSASMNRALSLLAATAALLIATPANAAAPGISSTGGAAGAFSLTAAPAFITQPDGNMVYSWGYGCAPGSSPAYLPAAIASPSANR